MVILTTIEYLFAIMLALYLIGIIVAWVYEVKRNVLYRRMKEQVRLLESSHFSMAVVHAKTYKITQDYCRTALVLERVQQFILKKVLLIGGFQRLSSNFDRK